MVILFCPNSLAKVKKQNKTKQKKTKQKTKQNETKQKQKQKQKTKQNKTKQNKKNPLLTCTLYRQCSRIVPPFF